MGPGDIPLSFFFSTHPPTLPPLKWKYLYVKTEYAIKWQARLMKILYKSMRYGTSSMRQELNSTKQRSTTILSIDPYFPFQID